MVAVVPDSLPVAGGLLSVGLTSVLPVEGRLDVEDVDVGGVAELVPPDGEAGAVVLGRPSWASLGPEV